MLYRGIQQTTAVKYPYWSIAELLPVDKLKQLQFDRLTEQITYLWNKSLFYQNKWKKAGFTPDKFKTIEDIRLIPFITKEEIRQSQEDDPPYGILRLDHSESITRLAMTSGTTGKPVLIPFTEKDYFGVWCEGVVRSLWAAGVRKDDVVHVAFGFTPFVGLYGAYDACEHLIGCQVIPGGAWNSLLRLKMIKQLKVTVLLGTPTYLLHLAEVAKENGIDPGSLGVRIIMTTGEPGMMSVPSTGLRLKETYNCAVFENSGTQETNYISWVCENGTGHMNDDLLYFEVLDPETNNPVESGQPGKLVITDLVQKTHTLIRFETGDVINGIESGKKCDCGRTLSHFKGFSGRTGDIIKVRGVSVSVAGVENVIRSISECSNNYEYSALTGENGLDKVKVRVEPQDGIEESAWEALRKKVKEELYLAFMITIDVEVVPPKTLPVFELKATRFRDLRSK